MDHELCPYCGGICRKHGKMPKGKQIYMCKNCNKFHVANIKNKRVRLMTPEERTEHIYKLDKKHNQIRSIKLRNKRNEIIKLLGNKCIVCGRYDRLELHHITYNNGNPYKDNRLKAYRITMQEAATHPENFMLLCHTDHSMLTRMLKYEKVFDMIIKKHKLLESSSLLWVR